MTAMKNIRIAVANQAHRICQYTHAYIYSTHVLSVLYRTRKSITSKISASFGGWFRVFGSCPTFSRFFLPEDVTLKTCMPLTASSVGMKYSSIFMSCHMSRQYWRQSQSKSYCEGPCLASNHFRTASALWNKRVHFKYLALAEIPTYSLDQNSRIGGSDFIFGFFPEVLDSSGYISTQIVLRLMRWSS